MIKAPFLLFPLILTAGLVLEISPGFDTLSTQIKTKTFTYKKVGDLEIKALVLRSNLAKTSPVVVWIHGGALIMGGREGIDTRAKKMLLDAGYTIVSIDYRLAPETKLDEIIIDLEDAFRWVRNDLPGLLDVETERLAVMGASAGGYLTLTAGLRVRPRPTALISFYGYGDLVGDWYSTPSRFSRHQGKTMTEVDLRKILTGPPVANAQDRDGDGEAFYQYCRQKGLWPRLVSGWDPRKETEKFIPYMPLQNISSDYPPTVLIHGTSDTDVPYEMSALMAQQLAKHGVPFELHTLEGAEHGLAGAEPLAIEKAYTSALRFLNQYMRGGL